MSKIEIFKSYKQQFLDTFQYLTYHHNPWNAWMDYISMFACSLSNAVDKMHFQERESHYMSTVKRYTHDELELIVKLTAYTVMALEENPEQDFLGSLFVELQLQNGHNGQFFTPYHVSYAMADMQCHDIKDQVKSKGFISVNDCACGAGSLLIAFANAAKRHKVNYQSSILFVAQDIDRTAALMCYIQLSLLGCPGYVIVGDSLSSPPVKPLPEDYDVWYTMMYFSDIWRWRRAIRHLKEVLTLPCKQIPDTNNL